MTTAMSTGKSSDSPVIYSVDAADVLVEANHAFFAFANENDGRALEKARILGTSIWEHISDEGTRDVYRTLMNRVRGNGRTIHIPFRCDAPELRRIMTLTIRPRANRMVEFVSELDRTASRTAVELLRAAAPRSDETVRMCSMCKRVEVVGRGWLEVEEGLHLLGHAYRTEWPRLNHVMCTDCFEDVYHRR